MVRDPPSPRRTPPALLERIARRSRAVVALDALAAANALFGDAMPANLLLVGAAYQAGALPVSAAAIEWAIELNGVAVAANTARSAGVGSRSPIPPPSRPPPRVRPLPRPDDLDGARRAGGGDPRLAGIRAPLLAAYQDARTARRYVDDLLTGVAGRAPAGGATRRSARRSPAGLHKLTAYKDEYEVARLLTDPAFEARLAAEVPGGTGLRYRLHPPTLKALGRQHKIAFGPWMRPVLQTLAAGRCCAAPRSTRSAARRSASWSALCATSTAAMVLRLAAGSRPDSYATAVAAAEAADLVRGYEDVKLAGVRRYRARLAELGLSRPDAGRPPFAPHASLRRG